MTAPRPDPETKRILYAVMTLLAIVMLGLAVAFAIVRNDVGAAVCIGVAVVMIVVKERIGHGE